MIKMDSSSVAAKLSFKQVITAKILEEAGARYEWGEAWIFPDGSRGVFSKLSALASGNNLSHYLFEIC